MFEKKVDPAAFCRIKGMSEKKLNPAAFCGIKGMFEKKVDPAAFSFVLEVFMFSSALAFLFILSYSFF